MDVRWALVNVRELWYPIMRQLHRLMIVISRVSVNHDWPGGTALDPSGLGSGEQGSSIARSISGLMLILSLFLVPGFLGRPQVLVHGGLTTGADVAAWPCCVCLLCEFSSFLGTLHWPADFTDLGHVGVSNLEVFILFVQWAGHRLLSEKVVRPHVRAHRPISISSVPVTEGVEIRQAVAS